jgi:hypothetical protein
MKYPDGQDAKLGDKVTLNQGAPGIVVCSIDTGEYSASCPEEEWSYLKQGIIVDFPSYGLIHYTEPDADLRLVARGTVASARKSDKIPGP